MDIEVFLQDLVLFINEASGAQRNDILQKIADKIMYSYLQMQDDEKETFYNKLTSELQQDAELYSLVLSTFYFISLDQKCLHLIEELLLTETFDIFTTDTICFQLNNIRFRDQSIVSDYGKQRAINRLLLERFEKDYSLVPEYIPYEKRNKKRIVIETDCLLSSLHAPSHLIFEMCKVLQCELNYEVFVLVNMPETKTERMQQFWFLPYARNYDKKLKGDFKINYEGTSIIGYQLTACADTMQELETVLKRIEAWNPFCIWHIGGSGFLHDIYRNMTTVLSMSCTDGYSVSEAAVMVSYMQSNSEAVREQIAYIEKQGQNIVNIKWALEHRESGKNYSRTAFGIPEDSFLICIVGNRLKDEMSEEFLDMMQELVLRHKNFCLCIIGSCPDNVFPNLSEKQVKYLGFCDDLLDVIKLTDLFVNPPRKGGGGGAVRAIAMGVPVVTLPACDVANVVDAEFFVQDLGQMKQRIEKYAADREYYQLHQEKARELYQKRIENSNPQNVKMLLDQVDKLLRRGKIQ